MNPFKVAFACIFSFGAGAASFALGAYFWVDRKWDFS